MGRPQLTRFEKLFFLGSLLLCAVGPVLSWYYRQMNRVPNIQLPSRKLPRANAEVWFLKAYASYVKAPRVTKASKPIDWVFAEKSGPLPYTTAYDREYPLSRKTAYLRANATALAQLRRGLKLPYAQTKAGAILSRSYSNPNAFLGRLLSVEAHARFQKGNRRAADSLLDLYHLGCVLPPNRSFLNYQNLRSDARNEIWRLNPYLSAPEAGRVAREMERWQTQIPTVAESLQWKKRARQENLLILLKQNDLRPLVAGWPTECFSPVANQCGFSPLAREQVLQEEVPRTLQIRLAWMNKPRLMEELTRCMDWQIAEARNPVRRGVTDWPFRDCSFGNTEIDFYIYPNYQEDVQAAADDEALDTRLITTLALRAFRFDHGRYPDKAGELVPHYLSKVPLDPNSHGQAINLAPIIHPDPASTPFPYFSAPPV